MSIVAGIDLGTTNSCIAVPANADIPGKQRLIEERWLREVGDALVITNPDKSPTTPSAVWVGPDGTVEVGLRAKNKARVATAETDTKPAMFFKRDMGTDQLFTAGHATLTPVEASAEILRHLKARAEEVLGVPVERAIITVPAFFEVTAKNETTEAGRKAGLEVVETLIEPVAAALAYSRMSSSEALENQQTFLVYDLGGGTFDTSVVTWDPEVGFENRSFHGDRYLGGYDFDRAIVSWLARRLPHHDLDLDPDVPADARILSQLLSTAEQTKHELTQFTETDIVNQHLADRTGEPMSIHEPISRADFEALIESAVKDTVSHCDQTLEQARITKDQLNEIVMVGGSSRMPVVGQVLSDHFGRSARILNPDLCVAVGAALKAATVARRSGYLELDHPEPMPGATDIGGRVMAGGRLAAPSTAKVVLTSDDGALSRTESPDDSGRFLFEDVPLQDADENGFTVQVIADGAEIDAQQFSVEPGSEAVPPPSGDVLAHDFSVELVDGLHTVVEVGTMLPYRTQFRLETASRGAELRVRLFEGMVPVGEVDVENLPPDLPVGTAVEVTLEFELGWTIQAEARIPKADAAGQATIRIPQRQVPSWEELRRKRHELRTGWEERRSAAAPADVLRVGAQVDRQLDEIDTLIDEGQDRTKTHHKVVEAETLLQGVPVASSGVGALSPPLEEFEDLLRDTEQLVDRLAQYDAAEAERHRAAIPGMRSSGRAAYESGDQLAWQRAVDAARSRGAAIYQKLPQDAKPRASAADLQGLLLQEIQQIAETISDADSRTGGQHRAAAEGHISEAQSIVNEVLAVDMRDDQRATQQLAGIYRASVAPLRARVEQWLDEVRTVVAARESGGGIGLTLPKSSMGGR
ncbi:actin-like ATPase involved in cell morphogenesis [Lipingzhangella halophila]|uniref:Actin-like ATPase involved in cell morphogenesis n=1 Tax=Lipingzhangella halophila TaxID=1783352 RepID=A0A7W7RJ49_9ACTN|nr:Hsp70 family protein [Lipingzhangella halophila]MBB4932949.1 actin-like ATPase involved in cell morphogenesis [Lipingzhangella halophila]